MASAAVDADGAKQMADVQARADLAALVQHEVKYFCGLVQNRSMSVSFSAGAGAGGGGAEENLHRYIALVKDEDGSWKGSLEHTWRVLFASPTSAFSVAPLTSNTHMERKQTATKVCVALAAQLKASGGTADELELRRCLLDAESEAGALYKHHVHRHFAGHVKDAAEELTSSLLKASFLRFISRQCANALVISSTSAVTGAESGRCETFVDFEVERRHTNVWIKGSAGMRAEKLLKQIERALRFGKFEHQAPGLGVCVSLDARTEEGAKHRAFLEDLMARESKVVEEKVEQHKAAMRAKAEVDEALQALPHVASTASIAMCYAFCSGSVLPSGSPLPRAWELAPRVAEKSSGVLLHLMPELCTQFMDANVLGDMTGKRLGLLEAAGAWYESWRSEGAGVELLSSSMSAKGPAQSNTKNLRDEYEAQLKRLLGTYSALYLAEGRTRNEARKEMEASLALVLERTGLEHDNFHSSILALRLPKSTYIESGGTRHDPRRSWTREDGDAEAHSGVSFYKRLAESYDSERTAFLSTCREALEKELGKIPTFIPEIDSQTIIANALVGNGATNSPPEVTGAYPGVGPRHAARDHSVQDASLTMECPPPLVGRLIGRQGDTIKTMQAQSGASIFIDQNFPENVNRVVTVRGSQASVDAARKLILDVMHGAADRAPGADVPRDRPVVVPRQERQQKTDEQKPIMASKTDKGPRYEKASFDKPKSFQEIMRVRD